jgi:hypothetical protein
MFSILTFSWNTNNFHEKNPREIGAIVKKNLKGAQNREKGPKKS